MIIGAYTKCLSSKGDVVDIKMTDTVLNSCDVQLTATMYKIYIYAWGSNYEISL